MCHAYLNLRQISGKSQAYPFYTILIRLEIAEIAIASLRVAAASGS